MAKIKILDVKYATYFYDFSFSFLEEKWTNSEGSMDNNGFKDTIINYLKFVNQYKIKKALIDTRLFNYIIDTDVQEWQNKEVFSKINTPVEKIAFLLPSNIFEEFSIKQVMEEQQAVKNHNEVKYFENEQDALNWLSK